MDKKDFETKEQLELDAAEQALETVSQEDFATVEAVAPVLTKEEEQVLKRDRMRFVTNGLSSTLALAAVLLNVFYFVSIYKTNNAFFYQIDIGLSVLLNLVFMLAVFLCSQGVKNYNKKHSIALIVIGAIEIARIFFLPLSAYTGEAMDSSQFVRVVAYLATASALLLTSGVIGVIRSVKLAEYKKSLEQSA